MNFKLVPGIPGRGPKQSGSRAELLTAALHYLGSAGRCHVGGAVSRRGNIDGVIKRQGRSFRIPKGLECQAGKSGHLHVDNGESLKHLDGGEMRSVCTMDGCPGSNMAYGLEGQRPGAEGPRRR